MTYVADTHPLVWLLADDAWLSDAAAQAFDDPDARIVVPTIGLTEIKYLHARNRITVSLQETLAFIRAAANCLIQPLDEQVVNQSPMSLDIHDAIVVGTALLYRDVLGEQVAVLTRDTAITQSGLIPVLW
jgi:PIN domain nuclease of toxin-antitoxin system